MYATRLHQRKGTNVSYILVYRKNFPARRLLAAFVALEAAVGASDRDVVILAGIDLLRTERIEGNPAQQGDRPQFSGSSKDTKI